MSDNLRSQIQAMPREDVEQLLLDSIDRNAEMQHDIGRVGHAISQLVPTNGKADIMTIWQSIQPMITQAKKGELSEDSPIRVLGEFIDKYHNNGSR